MKLRSKILTILTIVWAIVLLLIYFGFRVTLIKDYLHLEYNETIADVKLVEEAINRSIQTLENHTGDWAHWDDAYEFMANKNRNFITSDMEAISSYEDADLDMIVFFETKGAFFYGQMYDHHNRKLLPVPQNVITYIQANPLLMKFKDVDSKNGGILKLPEGYLLIASQPVTTSKNTGPIRGALMMAYFLNSERLDVLSKAIGLPVVLLPLISNETDTLLNTAKEQLKTGQQYAIIPSDSHRIYGFTYLKDIQGKPVGIIRIEHPRLLYNQGLETIRDYLIITILLGIIILALMWYTLKIFFLDRLLDVNKQITNIGSTHEFSKRLKIGGNDEITNITSAVNAMLEIIEITQEQLKYRLFQSTDALEKLSKLNKNLAVEIVRHKSVEFQLKNEEQQLRQLVYYDPLTSLPNRSFFYEFLEKVIHHAERDQLNFSILFLDIDDFKSINDTYGHEIGDKFLKHVADQLKSNLREGDLAVRLAGDEFIIYLHNTYAINDMIERILKMASVPLVINNMEIQSTISIGISVYPKDGATITELENHADLAMYSAKKMGGNSYYFYDNTKPSSEDAEF